MVTVELLRDGITYTVTAKGHATGSPEMCAAVSTLMTTLAGWAANAKDARLLDDKLDPGSARVSWRGIGASSEVFRLVEIGLRQLAASYPALISVTLTER